MWCSRSSYFLRSCSLVRQWFSRQTKPSRRQNLSSFWQCRKNREFTTGQHGHHRNARIVPLRSEELALRVLGRRRPSYVGISRTFQKQRGRNLRPMPDLLLSWRRLLAKHDRARWLESEHAQKHAGCNIWVLDRDQPALPRCRIDRRQATVLTAAELEERNLSMSVPRRSGDVAVWPMTA